MKKVVFILMFLMVSLDAKILNKFASSWDFNEEGYQLIDIRMPKEWESGVIKGAYKISILDDNGNFNDNFVQEVEKVWDKKSPIVLICRTGNRSLRASKILEKQGFAGDIVNLTGGMNKVDLTKVVIE